MRHSSLVRFALTIGAAAFFVGCGGSLPPIAVPGATTGFQGSGSAPYAGRLAQEYSVLFSFDSTDGALPTGDLLNVGGTLYGTTYTGGSGSYCTVGDGCGTVFSVTTSGTETVIYKFLGPPDGSAPNGGLTDVNGTLYGTTNSGGTCKDNFGCGTVFSVTTAGMENVLYRFAGGKDGSSPSGGLVDVNGLLYGTTPTGGSGCGTVYSISPTSGEKTVLHRFATSSDGCKPGGGLTYVNGTLYGTTGSGGSHEYGTVFSVTLAGTEKVLYNFAGSPDGAYPQGGLLNVDGTLYGATSSGGKPLPCRERCGTVFSVTTAGAEQVLHRFGGDHRDGGDPSGLVNIGDKLYGTTYYWGKYKLGTVFSITTTGKERVLYNFNRVRVDHDGANPLGGLTDVNNMLYGTTVSGGDYEDGTVFTLKP
jgi:uncharacterized repeat protein (TIGR03803 family)